MRIAALFLFAASVLQFNVTGLRGRKESGISIEALNPDSSGWYELRITRAKDSFVLIWPPDRKAAPPDGPEPVPVVVIQRNNPKALRDPSIVARLAVPVVLGDATLEQVARTLSLDTATLGKAVTGLATAQDPFQKGVGLLYINRTEDAVEPLSLALKERQRQLTRIPSEIYPAAMVEGRALFLSGKYDSAAVAFLNALKQRPSDERAKTARAEALVKAGKAEAAR